MLSAFFSSCSCALDPGLVSLAAPICFYISITTSGTGSRSRLPTATPSSSLSSCRSYSRACIRSCSFIAQIALMRSWVSSEQSRQSHSQWRVLRNDSSLKMICFSLYSCSSFFVSKILAFVFVLSISSTNSCFEDSNSSIFKSKSCGVPKPGDSSALIC